MLKLPFGTIRVLLEGMYRSEFDAYIDAYEEYYQVDIRKITDTLGDATKEEALMRALLRQFKQYIKVSRKLNDETYATVSDIDEPGRLADMITSHLSLKLREKQTLLETEHVTDRLEKLLKIISDEKKVLNLEKKIGDRKSVV